MFGDPIYRSFDVLPPRSVVQWKAQKVITWYKSTGRNGGQRDSTTNKMTNISWFCRQVCLGSPNLKVSNKELVLVNPYEKYEYRTRGISQYYTVVIVTIGNFSVVWSPCGFGEIEYTSKTRYKSFVLYPVNKHTYFTDITHEKLRCWGNKMHEIRIHKHPRTMGKWARKLVRLHGKVKVQKELGQSISDTVLHCAWLTCWWTVIFVGQDTPLLFQYPLVYTVSYFIADQVEFATLSRIDVQCLMYSVTTLGFALEPSLINWRANIQNYAPSQVL